MLLLILGKIGVAAGCALIALGILGAVVEDVENNHPGKPLMIGCHGTLVCLPGSSVARPNKTFLCRNTTRLP